MKREQGTTKRTRTSFDIQLQKLLDDLLLMGSLVDVAIRDGVRSLKTRDLPLAAQVVGGDENVNRLRDQVEHTCLDLIARQQPAAGDLRFIIAAMNIALELERMADHAANIAGRAQRLSERPSPQAAGGLDRMAEMVREMVRASLDALVEKDADAAMAVAAGDGRVDLAFETLFAEIVTRLTERSEDAAGAAYQLFCAQNLERIGDRATNICERVVFAATGRVENLDGEEPE